MTLTPEELRHEAELLDSIVPHVAAYLRACADAESVALQGGLSNAELVEAWRKKLPKVEASDRDLTAFALGVEVGCTLRPDETAALRARVAELEAQVAAKQAKIDRAAPLVKQIEAKVDALMLERCSDEMTPEQLTAWVTHQQAIRARGAGEKV